MLISLALRLLISLTLRCLNFLVPSAPALAQLSEAQAALAEARATAESEAQRRAAAETTAGHLRSDLASAQESLNTLEKVGGAFWG